MYDIIGDIHGYATKLKDLLTKLHYTESASGWIHTARKIIFVGDYIDRGPEIRETLQIIKTMVDNGNAYALMGNHEYNALAYHTKLEDGSYLRKHNKNHTHQHQETMDQFQHLPEEWNSWLQWFYTLPVFLELPGLRAVHACWDEVHIAWLKNNDLQKINPQFLLSSYHKGSQGYEVIDDKMVG